MSLKEKSTASFKNKSDKYTLESLDKALETAFYYGFKPIKFPKVPSLDILPIESNTGICSQKVPEHFEKYHKLENKAALLRLYMEGKFQSFPFPILLSYRESGKNSPGESFLNLLVIGALGSIAEALTLKASLAILNESSNQELEIELNSVGDKECFLKFEKELSSYIKKHGGNHSANIYEFIKKEVKEGLDQKNTRDDDFLENMPKPLNYLTPLNIRHFKEVLEYLEFLEIGYNLNHFLIPNRDHCGQTIFRIKNGSETLALGLSHQNIARKLKARKDIPVLAVVVKDDLAGSKKISIQKIKPKFFLVQFGNKAKARCLVIIEILRKAEIPLEHLLVKDKLLGQLTLAENSNYSYILIIGEKEALEDSVLVRNIETRVQETVLVSELVNYLKRIK